MQSKALSSLRNALDRAKVISSDAFDTLLLRTHLSQRARMYAGERRFAELLRSRGHHVSVDVLFRARREAQRLAFRALDVGGRGEARLDSVVTRQLRALGLPDALLAERLRIELEVEKRSLFANRVLAAMLRERRRAGARVVVVSDTMLSGAQLAELVVHCHGTDVVDRVYTSADHAATKRNGELFRVVAGAEGVTLAELVHIGDDARADWKVPATLGVPSIHLPRPALSKYLRQLDGARVEGAHQLRARHRARSTRRELASERSSFAREVWGPILVELCLLIWLYVTQAAETHEPVLLFCTRGGVGIREIFERVAARLQLPLRAPHKTLMVSRLVAARAALLARSRAAIEELGREFHGGTFADVANAIGGRRYDLDGVWSKPFVAERLIDLLHSHSGAEVLADVRLQSALFERHLRACARDSDRLILCDTGLYGSTQRLLADGFPDLSVETIQFARSNYKGHGEEHFPRVAGLLVEDNFYNPLSEPSCVLRYWHLVEDLFEPRIASVRSFAQNERGEVSANCGPVEPSDVERSGYSDLLLAALAYVDALPRDGGAHAIAAAELAWHRLTLAITRPGAADVMALEVGARSVDFGRARSMRVLSAERSEHFSARLMSIKSQHWREGAIAQAFPVAKHALLPALSSVHMVRRLTKTRF